MVNEQKKKVVVAGFVLLLFLVSVGSVTYALESPSATEGNQSGSLEVTPQADGTVVTGGAVGETGENAGGGRGAGSGVGTGESVTEQVQPTVLTGALDDPSSVIVQGGRLADGTDSLTIAGLLRKLQGILNAVIPFIIGLTILVIIWGIFTYVTEASNEEKRTEARQFILYGIIGLFCMLSIWGFVNILVGTFSIDNTIEPGQIPTVPTIVPRTAE